MHAAGLGGSAALGRLDRVSLYRKYRPATFAEVVGQEQVTRPLSSALDSGRINHAYLFSGPRGCGKTSSARILARSLNCVDGPTSRPCGRCDSCRSLAPGGSGNLDVTELDAASHNGVDDMRELRDRAYYAPAESRYRVFIIDEAHMISNAGSNALLKIVEEPPEHLIFVFATTEPEKVIGTIRSRTHHYPFRLLTPQAMRGLLERTVASEGVEVEDAVYPLVIRAGGGSPRDSLSILDQLLAGAGPGGLTYGEALPLLGVTDLSLIDATVDALASGDKSALFSTIDQVIEAGIEPRRYISDLLDRLRDLMVLQAVPEALDMSLVEAPTDRADVLREQAARFTGPQIARLADEVNSRIGELRGATSQRLLLEILAAHLLLPAEAPPAPLAESPRDAARAAVGAAVSGARPSSDRRPSSDTRVASETRVAPSARAVTARAARPSPRDAHSHAPHSKEHDRPAPSTGRGGTDRPAQASRTGQHVDGGEAQRPVSREDLVRVIRRDWSEIRSQVGRRNRVAEIMLAEAKVVDIRDGVLLIGHHTGALAERLNASSNNKDIVAVVRERAGTDLQVRCVVGTAPREVDRGDSDAGEAPTERTPAEGAPAKEESAEGARTESAETAAAPRGRSHGIRVPHVSEKPAPRDSAHNTSAASRPQDERRQKTRRVPSAPRTSPKADPGCADDIPLPPEPADEDAVARAESLAEEEEMAQAAAHPGTKDRRNALAVAMDLVAEELGGTPL